MEEIRKVNVHQVAARLDRPFSMVDIASVGDVVVSLYVCDGVLQWHTHIDVDELFWVDEGNLFVDTEIGEVPLHPGEVVVVPKGVEHRSRSVERSLVMLVRCGIVPERKNGRNRLYASGLELHLRGLNLEDAAGGLARTFWFRDVARVDSTVLQVAQGEGTWPTQVPTECDQLLYVIQGTMGLRTSSSVVHLHPGEFAVVPTGIIYQLSTTKGTKVARVARAGTSV